MFGSVAFVTKTVVLNDLFDGLVSPALLFYVHFTHQSRWSDLQNLLLYIPKSLKTFQIQLSKTELKFTSTCILTGRCNQDPCALGFAHYFLANDTLLNFHLMTQLWALTVDSSWLPRDPTLRERGGMRQTRWDVITPCNLEEIHWAALSQDESIPLVLSLYIHQVPLLARNLIKGSEYQFCLVGVPQGLVLGPAQISYSPGAMFFPQGVAPQTDSQTAHPIAQAQPASTQLSWDPP